MPFGLIVITSQLKIAIRLIAQLFISEGKYLHILCRQEVLDDYILPHKIQYLINTVLHHEPSYLAGTFSKLHKQLPFPIQQQFD